MTRSEAVATGSEILLEASDVTVRFGGMTALDGVDLSVPAGSIVGLVGPNGAGKSTLLGVLSGYVAPGRGRVTLGGRNVTKSPAHVRAQMGLARTFQQPELFSDLSVRDHFTLAHRMRHSPVRQWTDPFTAAALRRPRQDEAVAVSGIVELLALEEFADRPAVGLPLGVSRLVEIGRALASTPRVILLDEPSSGLDGHETELLTTVMSRIVAEKHLSLVLVEHDVEMVLSLSASVTVLDFGRRIACGTPSDVRADEAVQAAYLGSDDRAETGTVRVARAHGPLVGTNTPPLLSIKGITVHYAEAQALADVSFEAREGSVVAILGANGAGKSTLARAASGLVPISGGQIEFAGQDISAMRPDRIRRLGMAYLPEGRGVFPGLSVLDNLRMAARVLPRSERPEAITRAEMLFPVLGQRRSQLAGSLSGGEQQMLSLARVLAVKPRLIFADEVSLGLAPLVVDEVFDGLRRGMELGVAVVVIEQFVQRALELADHCYILRRGGVAWEGQTTEAGAAVLDHYLGEGGSGTRVRSRYLRAVPATVGPAPAPIAPLPVSRLDGA